jgi:hypothetical protein
MGAGYWSEGVIAVPKSGIRESSPLETACRGADEQACPRASSLSHRRRGAAWSRRRCWVGFRAARLRPPALPEHDAAGEEFDAGGFENFENILAMQILSKAAATLEEIDYRAADAQAGR